jgi:hypothetical protein
MINMILNKFGNKSNYFEQSIFDADIVDQRYMLSKTQSILSTLEDGRLLVLNNIENTIQTSLYDLLNKFYLQSEKRECLISNNDLGRIRKV